MARITYANALPAWHELGYEYGSSGEFLSTSGKKATWGDGYFDNHVVLEGEGLKFKDGALVAGTVTKITFEDVEGADLAVMTGEFSAKTFANLGSEEMWRILGRLTSGDDKFFGTANNDYIEGNKGNDIIKGYAGSDLLWGGRGRDVLVGGSDSDYFLFNSTEPGDKGDGNDIIRDFDADGSDGSQDYIGVEGAVLDIHKDGRNTVIEFEGGSFTLIDVKPSEITEADFGLPPL